MAQGGRRNNAPKIPVFPLFPSLSLSLSSSFRLSLSFRHGEGGKEGTMDCVRGCKGARGRPPILITPRCLNRGGRTTGPSQDAVKGVINQVYTPPLLLAHHASCDSMGYGNYIPNGHHDYRGASKAQGSESKPASRVRATYRNLKEGWSDTKGGQHLAHPVPHRGDPTSSSFVSGSRPRGLLDAPPRGLAPSRPSFPARDYLGKTLETTKPRFDPGGGRGGGISPCLIL
jgi:hypothetical protein